MDGGEEVKEEESECELEELGVDGVEGELHVQEVEGGLWEVLVDLLGFEVAIELTENEVEERAHQ